MKILTSAEL